MDYGDKSLETRGQGGLFLPALQAADSHFMKAADRFSFVYDVGMIRYKGGRRDLYMSLELVWDDTLS